jgi:uncharacterized protein YndB with AHSA1/START domain
MAKLTKSIVINAPVEKVFDYMDDPTHLPEIWPSLAEVSDVGRLPNGGATYKFIYKISGLRLNGYSEDTEYIKNVRTVSKTSGGVDSLATVVFDPVDQGTRVTITNEYVIPVPVLGKLAEAAIVKMNDQEAETIMANLKAKMEA